MKNKLFICFFAFSIAVAQAQDSGLNLEQKMLMSELDKTYDIENEETGIWTLFVRKFGSEKVMVRFPKKPEFHCDSPKEKFSIQCLAESATYKMIVDPARGKDIASIFDEKKRAIEKNKKLFIKDLKQNGNTLDLTVGNPKDGTIIYKTRIFVTNEHIYQLITQIKSNTENDHKYFIQSFQILSDQIFKTS